MKHLCLISLIWAIAFSVPSYLIKSRELDLQENLLKAKLQEQEIILQLLKQQNKESSKPSVHKFSA